MEQVLGNVLKVNSIDVFPQTKDKPNAFTRIKSDESAYELVSNNELLAEISNNKKDWGCINSQLDIPFDLVTNATPVSNQYTVVASSNALPDTNINNIVTTTISFNEAQTYPMEVARVADYPAGFYRFGGYCSAEDFVIYITYENDDTLNVYGLNLLLKSQRFFSCISYAKIQQCVIFQRKVVKGYRECIQ